MKKGQSIPGWFRESFEFSVKSGHWVDLTRQVSGKFQGKRKL